MLPWLLLSRNHQLVVRCRVCIFFPFGESSPISELLLEHIHVLIPKIPAAHSRVQGSQSPGFQIIWIYTCGKTEVKLLGRPPKLRDTPQIEREAGCEAGFFIPHEIKTFAQTHGLWV